MKNWPQIIQAGMGINISTSFLARQAALNGCIGTVSGALADQVLVRELQRGDPGGHFRRALSNFPYQAMADEIIDKYWVPGGYTRNIKQAPPMTLNPKRESISLVVCATFALVWIAKEGHNNPISINFMEKIQMPLIYGITGAMLANVDCVTVGAGIPTKVPGVLDAISEGRNPSYDVSVDYHEQKIVRIEFDLKKFFGNDFPKLKRPSFIPIISSTKLANILLKRSNGSIEGFVVENFTAGGHNAPPRDGVMLDENGEPIYNQNDIPDLSIMRATGLPFWLAGGYASKEKLAEALSEGATGVQLGSIFALCMESGMRTDVKLEAINQLYRGKIKVFTDPFASPTGFPFKTVNVVTTMADTQYMENRKRVCDLGGLLKPFQTKKGKIAYRCSAEPKSNYLRKLGTATESDGAYCLCNGLIDNSTINEGGGASVLTLGTNIEFLSRIIDELDGCQNYSVSDVMKYMGVT